jgi:hypothetical protein
MLSFDFVMKLPYGLAAELWSDIKWLHPRCSKDVGPRLDFSNSYGSG